MAEQSSYYTPYPVLVHPYPGPTPGSKAYERLPPLSSSAARTQPKNALIFIGGITDGPHGAPFLGPLVAGLQKEGNWSLFEPRIASAFSGWGFGSLADDVRDLAALVAYLRKIGREKIVIMGHSTGSNDCVEYADYAKHENLPVDGFVLLGPVSDRQSLALMMEPKDMNAALAYAKRLIGQGRKDAIMPQEMMPAVYSTPISAYRWHSMASYGGDDDVFSSDLSDDKVTSIWSRFKVPVLVLFCGEDEHVPPTVDTAKLLESWTGHAQAGIVSPLSGSIPEATHMILNQDGQEWMADRVLRFLEGIK